MTLTENMERMVIWQKITDREGSIIGGCVVNVHARGRAVLQR